MEQRAALRYAKAVLDLAIDNKATEAVERDMRSVTATIADSKELRAMLASPVVNGETKKEALKAIFKDNGEITKGLINTLTDNKRIGLLNEVALKYIILNEDLKGEGVAYVTTAVPLTPELEKKALKQIAKITEDKVTIENKIDPSLIGGFILRVGDLQYDASVANKLNTIKRELTNTI
ncbi:ATP synthase F1 subunit delta [Pricia sp. S334]|uniref:ATP synthase subunit delta n=1 Tax=Pricia mediterranea TaxID=3076079 RepID=A0ABU3L5Q2_9FLAO|nr:ATP synthase F1 subunit delta [Pricia sp. S334]MDT7828975.1 ATP synthase F1 subunit delta [Pricia sp. S334]